MICVKQSKWELLGPGDKTDCWWVSDPQPESNLTAIYIRKELGMGTVLTKERFCDEDVDCMYVLDGAHTFIQTALAARNASTRDYKTFVDSVIQLLTKLQEYSGDQKYHSTLNFIGRIIRNKWQSWTGSDEPPIEVVLVETDFGLNQRASRNFFMCATHLPA